MDSNRTLIGLTGRARSGKDTAGKYLAPKLSARLYAFAHPIKEAAKFAFGLTDEHVHGHLKETPLELYGGKTPRYILQTFGTDFARRMIVDDVWIKRAERELSLYPTNYIITDVRFDNEAEWVRAQGGTVIQIQRENAQAVEAHASEKGVSPGLIDHVIDNSGTLQSLYDQLDNLNL